MAIVDYKTHTECLSTDGFPHRPEGWFLKHMDTGRQYYVWHGGWFPDGLGLSLAPLTKSGRVTTDERAVATVTFEIPFAANNYSIQTACHLLEEDLPIVAMVADRLPNEFTILTLNAMSGERVPEVLVNWLCVLDNA